MNVIIKQWGDDLGIGIPQSIANKAGLTVGSIVNMEVVNNKIIISPVRKQYELSDLIEGVTPELVGGEYDWGKSIGQEI